MPYALALFFDSVSEKPIRELWKLLAESGVSSSMLDADIRPHLSLAVFDEIDIERTKIKLERFSRTIHPFELTLSTLGTFPGETFILLLGVSASRTLNSVHQRIHRYFREYADRSWWIYREKLWVPHCTLAMDIDKKRICEGFELCLNASLPLNVRICEIGLAEVLPAHQLCSFQICVP